MYEDAHLESDYEDRCNGGIPVDNPDYGDPNFYFCDDCQRYSDDCECF